MPLYAHSLKDRPEVEWERLSVHLDEVARETALRSAKFGCASLGAVAGWLHDFGKCKPAFQAYLRDPKVTGKNHAAAGAIYARRKLGWLGGLVTHAVAGHHAGLKDGLLSHGGRLDEDAAEFDLAIDGYLAANKPFELPEALRPPDGFTGGHGGALSGFQSAFLARMLFSGLVDADRVCTEVFYAEAEGRAVERGPNATIEQLRDALADWMDAQARRRLNSGDADRPVNLRRAHILKQVRLCAADPRGVFTLTVPTGGGKTLTSLDFALRHAAAHGLDRVIVVIPFTSVIEQSAEVYRKALGPFTGEVLEHHSAFDEGRLRGEERQGLAKLQLNMENWDSRIVITTAVQFFESLFSNRPSQCRKLHNVARSVVVLDEAQTMPLHLLRPCVAALKELQTNYGTSIVLSTATQPALIEREGEPDRSFPGGFRNARELAPDVPDLFRMMRRVTVRPVGDQDDVALAARFADASQALCIVNRRQHARDLYRLIAGPDAHHLSTLMHAAHRSRVLAGIRQDLKAGRPCRVVSTSLIEAGVDVDFPLVMRAETGLDQLAQAAGRLNREGRREIAESLLLIFKPAGQQTPKDLAVNVEVGAEMIRSFGQDCLDPAAIEAYFSMLYWKRGPDDLDRHGVLKACVGAARSLDFPFEQIARGMRLIDSAMRPIIVANDEESRRWLAELEDRGSKEPLRTIARKLQRYTVGLPARSREALIAAGVAVFVREDTFNDQFLKLLNLDLYRPDLGLDSSDPYFAEAGSMVV